MIQPNTTLILIKNIPFDNTYEHTVSYESPEAQHADLVQGREGVDYITVGTMTYQRYTKNSIRVQKPIEEIIECNYMCYKNTNYENKWIYAFITRMDYVNDITTEIEYEIDVMQTWFLFETTKEISFIEREHTATDKIGDNITPEPIELGEYIFSDYDKLTELYDEMAIIIGVTTVVDGDVDANVYDNNVSGETLFVFDVPEIMQTSSGRSGIIGLLNKYIDKPEAITSMYLCPSYLIDETNTTRNTISDGSKAKTLTKNFTIFNGKDINGNKLTFNGYKPKNNKLYTYPYNYLHIDNGNGQSLSLRYEFFENLQPKLFVYGNFTFPPTLNLVPKNYKGQNNEDVKIATEIITINNYPQSSWANDSYSNWVATQRIPLMLGGLSTVAQIGSGVITTAVGMATKDIGMATSGVSNISSSSMSLLNYITQIASAKYTASIKADVLRGSTSIGNANIAINENTFHSARCHITAQYAEIIDNYFSMFGYAINKYKNIEIRDNRENWTFIKTAGANLHGKCGNVYNRKMVSILDNGITFWKDSISNVCNYELSNNPLGNV